MFATQFVKAAGGIVTAVCSETNRELHTVIDRTYEMEEIRKAHIYSQSGRVKGKVIVNINTN